jgi:hypothetical protein
LKPTSPLHTCSPPVSPVRTYAPAHSTPVLHTHTRTHTRTRTHTFIADQPALPPRARHICPSIAIKHAPHAPARAHAYVRATDKGKVQVRPRAPRADEPVRRSDRPRAAPQPRPRLTSGTAQPSGPSANMRDAPAAATVRPSAARSGWRRAAGWAQALGKGQPDPTNRPPAACRFPAQLRLHSRLHTSIGHLPAQPRL